MTRYRQLIDCTTNSVTIVPFTAAEETAQDARDTAAQVIAQADIDDRVAYTALKQKIRDARIAAGAATTLATMKPAVLDFMDGMITLMKRMGRDLS